MSHFHGFGRPMHFSDLGASAADDPLRAADAVFAVDAATRATALVFGRDVFRQIATAGVGRGVAIVSVVVDRAAGELDRLLVLVRAAKGRDDFDGTFRQAG